VKRRLLEPDIFASAPGRGNPLAVVIDASGIDGPAMQSIAAWLNLSETTFVQSATQPGADYRVRIFTPRQELPFAGHPSVGTAHAALACGLATAGSCRSAVPACCRSASRVAGRSDASTCGHGAASSG
jgi:PhzF family phenazine biosynthesis protein